MFRINKLQGGAGSFFTRLQKEVPHLLSKRSVALYNVTENFSFGEDYVLRMDGLYSTKYFGAIDWVLNRRFKNKIRFAKGIIFQSEYAEVLAKNKFASLLKGKTTTIIQNGCSGGTKRQKTGKHKVVVIGRLGYMHNVNLTLELLQKVEVEVDFFIAPRSTFYERFSWFYRRLLQKLGQVDVNIFQNKSSSEIIEYLMTNKCILVYMSYFAGDACPNTVIEALSTGTPVITLDKGPACNLTKGQWSVTSDLDEATVFKQNLFGRPKVDIQEATRLISDLASNYEAHEAVALTLWKDSYDIKKVAVAYEDFLNGNL